MAPKNGEKPTITILYDAEEERVRDEALAKGEKFPQLVSTQVEEALTKRGYTVKKLAATPPIKKLVRQIEDDTSDLIFNVCESLGGDGTEERRIASILELLDKRFTGSGSLALTLAGDKSLAKKLFDFHKVSSPDFTIIAPGHVEGNPNLNKFPVIVKPIATDASIGINAKSVVHSVGEMMERVFAIHQEFHTPALVEEYIDGREIYLGLLGNPPTMLTPIEWDLSKLPKGMPRIAGSEAKWDEWKNPELKAAKEYVPDDIVANEEVMERLRVAAMEAWKALQIRDYARLDVRLTKEGVPYIIEVNPNPWLDKAAEFAMAARKTKPELSHGDMIERIVELAMARPMRVSEQEHAEMTWHEERQELLKSRINELSLRIEGSELEPMVQTLYRELDSAGLRFKPPIYLTDEWGCPEGVPVIGVPFYLAHAKLSRIEQEIAENLETPEESMMYLRHEAGHAFNYAYRLYEDKDWHQVFGPYSRPYREDYKPNPFSREYVRHIAGWYAQKHPDEDFAETFAVWLDPVSNWRAEYTGTPALRKLEYVDGVLRRIGPMEPLVKPDSRDAPVEEMSFTVEDYYRTRHETRIEVPRWFDGDLKQLFDTVGGDTRQRAEPLVRAKRLDLINEVSYWSGVQMGIVRSLVDHLIDRVSALELYVESAYVERYMISFTVMVTTLALNYLHHGRFTPDVTSTIRSTDR